jgi:cytochrome c oxidase assembly protein subunit 15
VRRILAAPDGRSRPVAIWLFVVAVFVLAMVVVGGATRLTGSGLSITQWKPIVGALPPMTDTAWNADFGLYKATSQYRLVNQGMSLAEFKFIFWWEWSHRLLGRLVGAVFAVPFVVFLLMRAIPRRLIWRCCALLGLGGLQGLVGWWMVKSGLEGRISVAPERLATHLGLALLLLASLIWVGLEAWTGRSQGRTNPRPKFGLASGLFAAGVFLQCLMGALVAGNQAGLVNNDWPLMTGALVPVDYWQGALWTTLAHGVAAVQFNHRLMAYALAIAGLCMAGFALCSSRTEHGARTLAVAVGGIVLAQATLGVATLMSGVALGLALLHQAGAAILLATAVALAWRTRRMDAVS